MAAVFNVKLSEMDNATLIRVIAHLVDEALDRCEAYDALGADYAEGLRFAKLARPAAWRGSGQRTEFMRIGLSDFERIFAARIVELAAVGDSGREFTTFLSDHPELTEPEGDS